MTELDRQTARLLVRLDELAGGQRPDMREVAPADARAGSRATWLALAGEDRTRCRTRRLVLPGPAGDLPAELYRPHSLPGPLALVVFFHGGGWVMGDVESYAPLVRALAEASGSAYLSVDYRLAPEHRFPAGLEDARAAVEWALDHAAEIDCDPDRIAVMGDSAGGNLATVVAAELGRERPGAVRAQFLIYPMLDVAADHEEFPSRTAWGDGRFLLANSDLDAVTGWYLDQHTRPEDPRVSPIRMADPGSLPPTVIVSAGFDPLTSEAERFADRLREAGVPCRTRCYESTIHAFMSFGDLEAARRARTWLGARVAELLAR